MGREDHLDEWSNAARDAIDAGRLDEAERLADQLVRDYPDVPDGHEVRGLIRQKQNRWSEALAAHERALSVVEAMAKENVGREMLDHYRGLRDAARARVR